MKKLLFMCINMNIGGTEKALLTMLNEIDDSKYDITLLMLEEYGGFLNEIPSFVKVKYVDEYKSIKPFVNEPPKILIKRLIKNKAYLTGLSTLLNYSISKITKNISYYYRYILKNVKKIDEEYDLAVAYAGPMDFITYFVLNKIKAKKKIQWIHFDITKIGFNRKFAERNYKKFDKIFVVSEEGKEKLIDLIPALNNKVEAFFNIISCNLIENMSKNEKSFDDLFDGVRILTVGRLSKEKGQELTINVLARLKNEGYKVRWYCIGDGPEKYNYRNRIKRLDIENDYILLGSKLNPYPFMKDCDIYVQPSKHEGYCITLGEARCFDNPIVTTNFTGANEQIKNEVTGLVCDISEEGVYKSVKRLLDDKKLYGEIMRNLKSDIVDSTSEVAKLYKVIEI
ncbi:glycosyltransferase [Clostridium disporicum]|uniref:Galactosyl transferase n=1 Tax=Clostridium disporicum TaxID=84024 RepID=A0A173Z5K7_9CLOT|nr:glycosyltransferase [Clostridium disporicum]CUN71534.1 galactosyl transferase [Clostridium disporicum]